MTKKQNAEMTMFETLKTELEKSSSIYAANNMFKKAVEALMAAIQVNSDLAAATHTLNEGFSQEKQDKKTLLANKAAQYAGKAYVALSLLNKTSLAEQFHKEPTDYLGIADLECSTLANNTIKLLKDNLDDLKTDDAVTQENIEELQKIKDDYLAQKGNSQHVHEIAPELRKTFNDSFALVKYRIEHLHYVVRDFKDSDPAFFDRVNTCSILPPIPVHHTSSVITFTDKATGKPLEGAEFEFSKAKKKAITDYNGIAEVYIMRYGKDLLIGTYKGVIFYQQHVDIHRGSVNQFTITIQLSKD